MSIIYALVGTNRVLIGIQILTIKLLLVISIVFGFFGTPCSTQIAYFFLEALKKLAAMQADYEISLFCKVLLQYMHGDGKMMVVVHEFHFGR
jgi:hypothetical protein